ncbi:MAG: imidazole glycerol phosphate synthase cyclase subunit [Bdellovibrionota bacterium]
MVETVRIIPRLDIKGPNLVKGIHLEGLRVMGDPDQFARYYYENGADELFYMDVVASLYERNSLESIISKTAKSVFIPITVGGGIRSTQDIRNALKAGADKVCLNTAAIKNPSLIKEASSQFGSSTIVVAIEAIKQKDGKYLCFIDNGREHTGIEAVQWAQQVEELGAGELVITSVDREGTGEGYDIELVRAISSKVGIPVIAHGGAGSPEDIFNVIDQAGVTAVTLASSLHYGCIEGKVFNSEGVRVEGNTTFLGSGKKFNKIKPTSIKEIKTYLRDKDVPCRL